MADRNLYPVALHWDLGPEKLKQMKSKLLVYFGSQKKSNGGECVMEDMDCTKGHVLIHFNQETVRDRVLQKQSHTMNLPRENPLNLIVTLPETATSEAAAKDLSSKHEEVVESAPLFLVENVRDPCTLEVLNLLLENVTEKDQTQDFHVEMVSEIRAAVVTFTCTIDIPDFIQRFSSSVRVKQMRLSAKPMEETRSVKAEGLPPNTSEDFVMLYFENPKNGGGSVQDTLLVPEENTAIITFRETGVARTVLAKKHVFGKTEISVYPYYVSLGIALYGKNGPPVTKPEPLEFPVSPYILEFILNDAQGKLHIEEKMASLHCDIKWPEELTCPNLVIRLCVSSKVSAHVRTLVKIAPTWRDKVSAEYKQLITKFKVAEFPGSEAVWEAIKQDIGSSAYSRVLVKPILAKEKIFLTGLMVDVTQTEPVLRKLIEDTRQKIHRQTQIMTDELDLAPALYEIMSRNGLEQNMKMNLPDLKMSYDGSRMKLLLSGLREEIYGSKCKIMEMERNLKHASISLDPHIVRFLKVTSSDAMSSALFIRRNINAVFEVEGDVIKLTGFSTGDVSEAEKIIKREMVCKKVTVEDKSLIKSLEWQSLLKSFQGFNAQQLKFVMEECPRGSEDQVVISGLSSAVNNIYEEIQRFIEENTIVTKDVQVQSMAVVHFMQNEKKMFLESLRKVKCEITQKKVTLTGPRKSVLDAAGRVDAVLSSLCTKTLRIDKPGAKKFCLKNDEVHVTAVKSNFHCVIYLQKDGDSSFTAGEVNLGDSHFQITISGGVTIAVYKGDLSRHRVDVVVNAANEDLKHVGGLALALLNAAGPKLQADCDQIIRRNGSLPTGDSVVTDAGNLPCKHVIHGVGPRWDSSSQPKCERLLRKVITRSLELAAQNGHSSIAIPAVSSGIFGFPVKRSVENIIESIKEYAEDNGGKSSLKRIHLVDNNTETVQIFVDCVRRGFQDQTTESPTRRHNSGMTERDNPVTRRSSAERALGTEEGLAIKLVLQGIQEASTDVIVNSMGSDLDLNKGAASKALLHKAGPNLQALLDDESEGRQAGAESVFVTDGCNLNARKVFHVVTPQWDKGKGSSEKSLRQIIKRCLLLAEQKQLRSISFPALGTGNLGFPKQLVATLMFDVISKFDKKNTLQHLQEVYIVLLPSDTDTVRAFSAEAANLGGAISPGAGSAHRPQGNASSFFGSVASPDLGVHEMKIGPVTYQVKTGDITSEDTDVIVSSTNQNFTLRTGVSQAILSAAGQTVIAECAQLGAQPNRGYIVTSSGNLACQKILHVVGQTDPSQIKQSVLLALQECEQLQVTSVAFPAIGTGAGAVNAALVADAMIDAVVEFVTKKPAQNIQMVKVVLFQRPMLNDFYTSMKKKEGSAIPQQPSLFQRFTSWFNPSKKPPPPPQKLSAFQLLDNIEPAIFHLCAESSVSLASAESWLQKRILDEQTENTITDVWMKEFEVSEMQKFSELQKRLQVHVEYKPSSGSVRLSGLTRDVTRAELEIREMIGNFKDRKKREKEAEYLSDRVEWIYVEYQTPIPFDKFTSLDLEEAERDKKTEVEVKIRGRAFKVNLKRKTAIDQQGKNVKIERLEKHDGKSIELPQTWDALGQDLVKVVQLNPLSPEYRDVQAQFAKTCPMTIVKIERIQNKHLWQTYQIRKQNIDTRNGNTNNENRLFHGTDHDSVSKINKNGFNRSYAGRHAAVYGNGTYFAVNAQYSVSYSPADASNLRVMYLAKVLTGMHCLGSRGMVAPPPKSNSDPTDLYDSVTDSAQTPSMYIIFNDIQAYPEYLITFQ
uniref:Poly [ADP-ribose] polymerase n=1 Tax=Leptobrachium leishanense TaxID=445787 RepID=A0A8C5WDM2_9ANUR